METKLRAFFASPLNRRWLHSSGIGAYVRKGVHLGIDLQLHSYLDLASVEVKEDCRRQDRFRDFLALCQSIQPFDGILVENVHSEILRGYLRRLALADPRWREREMNFLWEKYLEETP